ncbi:RecQ family ATP-dependent DNA helicase [Alcanivorax sp. 1008]|uniref:RecQ family ATP-dependent DNA helicase n=1 Tax=Alcanivorax sp. 1008 TaxID=2816853 RepID=UPI00210740BB|nr:RecQ family ATP-dependent DNA helicase [Alcanivorax sp. 1008]
MTSPSCPKCGSAMMLRMARKGQNAGNQFWGCTKYPGCKGTRHFEDGDSELDELAAAELPEVEEASSKVDHLSPVDWRNGTPRPGWDSLYASVGALPGFLKSCSAAKNRRVEKLLSDTAIFRNTAHVGDGVFQDGLEFTVQVVLKLLQRGLAPLPTLGLESAAAAALNGLSGLSQVDPDGPDVGWILSAATGKVTESGLLAALSERSGAFLPDELIGLTTPDQCGYDSERERIFATDLLPRVRPDLAHWLSAQVSFPQLIPENQSLAAARRADFLISHPVLGDYVIEIDGGEHERDYRVDEERDGALRNGGYKVIRISNDVIDRKDTDSIKSILSVIAQPESSISSSEEQEIARAALICSLGAKLQFVLCDALRRGILPTGGHWKIKIDGFEAGLSEAISDFVSVLNAFDKIYGTSTCPSELTVSFGSGDCEIKDFLCIYVDPNVGELCAFPDGAANFAYLIRRSYFPRPLKIEMGYSERRRYCVLAKDRSSNHELLDDLLTMLLQYLFRKKKFRPGQLQALVNGLCGHDSIVLLPTGAGKSIIYQLTGLLQPGITLVVDPLVSLIEDQERVLSEYGIERVLGITSASFSDKSSRARILGAVKDAQYHFILMSPERLQTPEFRQALRALTQHALINCAVIDEAHCVSEWGHDFRPAYLNLARNLREFCSDIYGAPPSLFALTGTASRAVLRDMLVDLKVDQSNSNAIVRPTGFDRKELEFDLITCKPRDVVPTLEGVLASLPKRFLMAPAEFSANRARNTMSGIVFCPTVKGNKGVAEIQSVVSRKLNAAVAIYSGSSPYKGGGNWDARKRENASAFIENKVPAIVSTKAFGMGIDKPNVRYTIHVGMPGSLEAFYQEAGRAGRDQKRSVCIALYSEADEDRTRRILSPSLSKEEVDIALKEEPWNARSDANTAMFFHRNGYPGVAEEVSWVAGLLDEIGDIDHKQNIVIPMGSGETSKTKEKAIFRLLQIGMISDYTVDYGASKYDLEIDSFDHVRAKQAVLDYISRSQPGRAKADELALSALGLANNRESVISIVKYLIKFAYDVIEQARRRSISESFDAARLGSRDRDAFRRRLLEYLEEGVSSDFIESLLAKDQIDLDDWFPLLDQINNAAEAGEFRGIAIRYLESYPEHPGLLILRAVAEAMSGDCDGRRVREDIEAAFQFGKKVYGLKVRDFKDISSGLCDVSIQKAGALAAPLIIALGDGGDWVPTHDLEIVRAKLFKEYPEETGDLRATYAIQRLMVVVNNIAESIELAASEAAQ